MYLQVLYFDKTLLVEISDFHLRSKINFLTIVWLVPLSRNRGTETLVFWKDQQYYFIIIRELDPKNCFISKNLQVKIIYFRVKFS